MLVNFIEPTHAPRPPRDGDGHALGERRTPMNVRPLRDRVLVKRIEPGEQRIGGIIIPDTAKEKPQQAQVVAVGSGRLNDEGVIIPLEVRAGEYVLIGKYAGTEIKLDGEEYLIVREDEILGVAENVPEFATV
jgi:chaperonin GroES